MKKLHLLLPVIMVSIMAAMLASCDDGKPSDEFVLYDIACLESTGSNGSTFTLCKPGNNNVVTLKSPQAVDTNYVKPGQRLLIRYVPDNGIAYTSGSIALKGYGTVINGKLNLDTDTVPSDWDKTPVYIMSCWRSGSYLNMQLKLPYDNTPRKFDLMIPFDQLLEEYPDIYLVHALEADVNTFERSYYASFDISYLLNSTGMKGFTLHFNDSNLRINEMKFNL